MLEALSQGLPVVATRVSGVPELIEDGVNGLLAPAGDAAELARCLAAMIGDPERRRVLGGNGERRVRQAFGLEAGIDRLAPRFGLGAAS